MQAVIKIVNFIRSKALNHRSSGDVGGSGCEYGDVLYHQEIRWLSRGKVLKRFFDLRVEIKQFIEEKGGDVQLFLDEKWLWDLAFLVDITSLLNTLNLQLQGKEHLVYQLYDNIKAFEQKLQLLERQLKAGNLVHFSSLKEVNTGTNSAAREINAEYAVFVRDLLQEFQSRFSDFSASENDFSLFSHPFSCKVDDVPEELQMQLVELQCDSVLKEKYSTVPLQDFYKYVDSDKYPAIRKCAQRMFSLFGSTYICEQTFSLMKLNKSRLRGSLSDSHLLDVLYLSVSQLRPDVEKIMRSKEQFQTSH
ncbi:general mRNAion factor II-I repeat domain-containing protein 2-like [Huso huso]|uniref:General mRNAion factor II-I repeat domain-containing protein 2-like n=1 Tax=Huso huso TaxID=61971 RepID=A0ABR1A409_HUSHU